jgi:hypothetical protein
MKTQGDKVHMKRGSSETNSHATELASDPELDHEAIALLAYFYWEARGCPHDSPHEDWLRAEAELRGRHAASATA